MSAYTDALAWARKQKTSDLIGRLAWGVTERDKRSWSESDEHSDLAIRDALDERIPVPK